MRVIQAILVILSLAAGIAGVIYTLGLMQQAIDVMEAARSLD